MNEQRLHTAWQQKVFTRLLGLQYRVVYKPGADNRVADALSRRSHPEELLVVSSAVPSWLEAIVASYCNDPKAQDLLTKLAITDDPTSAFRFVITEESGWAMMHLSVTEL